LIGVQASITLGELRSIKCSSRRRRAAGLVYRGRPAAISNALFVSGGIQPIGSLRNVQLKRNGRVVTRLDLYDLLLNGDTSDDVRLEPGDAIFVPPIGPTAGRRRSAPARDLRGQER
jgi:protein involved in polysaccharide export with SLBB domain